MHIDHEKHDSTALTAECSAQFQKNRAADANAVTREFGFREFCKKLYWDGQQVVQEPKKADQSPSVSGENVVRLTLEVKEPWSKAEDSKRDFQAVCAETSYQILVARAKQRVELNISGLGGTVGVDVSETPLARRLLSRASLGRLHFSCQQMGLSASYLGVELQKKAQPQPFHEEIQYSRTKGLTSLQTVHPSIEAVAKSLRDGASRE